MIRMDGERTSFSSISSISASISAQLQHAYSSISPRAISPPSIDTTEAEERVISQKISSSRLGSNLLPFNEEEKMCLMQKKKKKTNISINDAILLLTQPDISKKHASHFSSRINFYFEIETSFRSTREGEISTIAS